MKATAALVLLWMAPMAMGQTHSGSKPSRPSGPAVAESRAVAEQTPVGASGQSAPDKAANASQDAPAKAAPKIDSEKEAAIRKLFEVQGTRKSMAQVIGGIMTSMRPTLASSLPPGEYRDKLIDLFLQKFQANLKVDDLVDLAVPVYDKYFSKEDIAGLTQFYMTPLGQKMNSVLPQVLIETQSAAAGVGEELGRKSMLEVLAEHPDLEKALEEASGAKN